MYIVFVKHYLNSDGIGFFSREWFPKVHEIMRQQEGFISLTHESNQDYDDCVNIVVKCKDQATFESWGYSPEHDAVVNALDAFRSKDYWECAIVENEHAEIKWQKVPSKLSI